MTTITTAMMAAYFAKPPTRDWLPIFHDDGTDQLVLACHIADRPRKANTTSIGEINAEIYVHQMDARERESGIGLEGDVGKTIYVDGVAKRLRGDGAAWRLKQKNLKRQEQAQRAKKFHPSMVDVKVSDFITEEDYARFHEEAKNIMAQLCNLSRYLPRTEILAVKWPARLLEMVEREMWSIEGAARERTVQIASEYRALGGGVPEITNTRIERLEQQKAGFKFQYAHCQMLFKAWREQYDEVMTEHEGLATSLPGAEFDGHTWNYVKLGDRVERRKKLAKETDKAWETQKAMLLKLPIQEYHKWLYSRQTYQPRHGGIDASEATPEVAQPMSGREVDSDPNDRE